MMKIGKGSYRGTDNRPQDALFGEYHMVAALSCQRKSLRFKNPHKLTVVDGNDSRHSPGQC
jgi:hypothetical protein